MALLRTYLFSVVIVSSMFTQTQGADKYTDGNRPYEFGFKIDGEQHRHEKKDEKGLIMGEFGFITADGVYHVTVYATDEQGRFKILSMKNIRVKPYPTYKRPEAGSERQGHSLDLTKKTIPKAPIRKPEPNQITIEKPAKSCSSCSLPPTKAPAPASVNYAQNIPSINPQPRYNNVQNGVNVNTQTSQYGGAGVGPGTNAQAGLSRQNVPDPGKVYPQQVSPNIPQQPISNQPGVGITRTAKKYDGQSQLEQGQALPQKPTLITAQMQIVDKNTDIYQRGPGEKEGLPKGLAKDDMTQLLYTFNYTVGFHGHHEKGYTDGSKEGYYFVTGRNGVRTRVDYVADEKGFRPKITQEVLDLLSDDVPKPETEKDEKYGLKGYEFKWLYFPVQSKGH